MASVPATKRPREETLREKGSKHRLFVRLLVRQYRHLVSSITHLAPRASDGAVLLCWLAPDLPRTPPRTAHTTPPNVCSEL